MIFRARALERHVFPRSFFSFSKYMYWTGVVNYFPTSGKRSVSKMDVELGTAECGSPVVALESRSEKNYGRMYVTCGCSAHKGAQTFHKWLENYTKGEVVPCKNNPAPRNPRNNGYNPTSYGQRQNRWPTPNQEKRHDPQVIQKWPQMNHFLIDTTEIQQANKSHQGPEKLLIPDEVLRKEVARLNRAVEELSGQILINSSIIGEIKKSLEELHESFIRHRDMGWLQQADM